MEGKTVLYGTDFSHWNDAVQVRQMCKASDFVFIKATEGRGYTDPMLERNIKIALEEGVKFIGLYHFARPDTGNSWLEEFEHFKYTIESVMHLIPDGINVALALDMEVERYNNSWVHSFTDTLYKTYKSSILYCSESWAINEAKASSINTDITALWVAMWKNRELQRSLIPWKTIAFHQYSNKPYDKTRFFGNLEQLREYFTARDYIYTEEECGCECNCCKAGNCE